MRKIFVALLTVCLFLTSADAADKVRIAFGTGASSVLYPLAQKKGFLKEEGIDAEVIQMLGNPPIAALTNGELDYNTVLNPSVRGAIQGLPIRVVACFDKGNQWVLVARSNLKSVTELRGKTVAAGTRGRGPDTAGRRIVKHYGLEPDKDVKFTPGGSSDEGHLVMRTARTSRRDVDPHSPRSSCQKVGTQYSCTSPGDLHLCRGRSGNYDKENQGEARRDKESHQSRYQGQPLHQGQCRRDNSSLYGFAQDGPGDRWPPLMSFYRKRLMKTAVCRNKAFAC